MNTPGLTMRANGGVDLGLGHIVGAMRLGRLLEEAGTCSVTLRVNHDPGVERILANTSLAVEYARTAEDQEDITSTIHAALKRGDRGILFNYDKTGLDNRASFFHEVKDAGLQLLFQDNPVPGACEHADLLINALPHPPYEGYDPASLAHVLEGLEYFLLDESLIALRQNRRLGNTEAVRRILVAMGGGDVNDLTSQVLRGLDQAGFEGEVDVVLGHANRNHESVRETLGKSKLNVVLSSAVSDMPQRIQAADLGISALGLTTYEMAALGLPVILIPANVFNGVVAQEYVRQSGAALLSSVERFVSDARWLIDDAEVRASMIRSGERIGTRRGEIVAAIAKTLAVVPAGDPLA